MTNTDVYFYKGGTDGAGKFFGCSSVDLNIGKYKIVLKKPVNTRMTVKPQLLE